MLFCAVLRNLFFIMVTCVAGTISAMHPNQRLQKRVASAEGADLFSKGLGTVPTSERGKLVQVCTARQLAKQKVIT